LVSEESRKMKINDFGIEEAEETDDEEIEAKKLSSLKEDLKDYYGLDEDCTDDELFEAMDCDDKI